MTPLSTSELIVLLYLGYLMALAAALRIGARRRGLVWSVGASVAALLVGLAQLDTTAARLAREWTPALYLLVGYRLSGMFFVGPIAGAERWLRRTDAVVFDRLGLDTFVRRAPRWVLELLEAAYLAVYPLVPLGVALVRLVDPSLDVDRYWTLVLTASLAAYACLPWLSTRTPGALGDHAAIEARDVRVRRLNQWIARRASIRVNTVPSGHAATACAIALAATSASPLVGVLLLVLTAAIVVGSVVGRYHFAIDGVLGIGVAIVAWAVL